MNPQWSLYLEKNAPVTAKENPSCAFSPLDDGLIRVTGEEARDFLQGQLTNDIRRVSESRAQLSGYCTPKGRMLALFLVFEQEGALYLQLPRERLEAVLERLRMFVLRSRVELADVSDEKTLAGVAGSGCAELFGDLPEEPFVCRQEQSLTLIRMPGETARVQMVGSPAAMTAFHQAHAHRLQRADDDYWPLQNIRAGLPTVVDATAEAFVPQMCNLDLLGGISFTKGCYTGQEVVARMRYLGQLKRRMYLARIDATPCPAPGQRLFSPSSRSAQGAGKVVDARPRPGGGCEALVVAEIRAFESGDLRLEDAEGPPLSLEEPPYGLKSEETPS